MDESITRAAGASNGQEMTPNRIQALIESIGRPSRQRSTLNHDACRTQQLLSFAGTLSA